MPNFELTSKPVPLATLTAIFRSRLTLLAKAPNSLLGADAEPSLRGAHFVRGSFGRRELARSE